MRCQTPSLFYRVTLLLFTAERTAAYNVIEYIENQKQDVENIASFLGSLVRTFSYKAIPL